MMKTHAPLKSLSVLPTALALCLSLSAGVAAQDLAKQQLALGGAEYADSEQRVAVRSRTTAYEDRRARLEQQIREVNATTALLGGAIVGTVGSLTPIGPVGGALSGALAKIAIEDWLNERLLHESARLTLMDTRAQDRGLFNEFMASAPGSEERSILTRRMVNGSPYMELFRALAPPAPGQGPLLEHAASLGDYLFGLDPGEHASIDGMTADEAAASVRREFPDLRDAVVEYGEVLGEGRSALLELARDVNDIAERLSSHGSDASTAGQQPERLNLGSVVVRRGDGIAVPDKVFTADGDIIDMSGQKIGEHDDRLDDIQGERFDLDAAYRRLLSAEEFEQSLIYEGLPTEAKLRALENPEFMRRLDPARREELRERLETQRDLQETVAAAQGLASVTSSLGNILTRTGVLEGEDAGRANDAAGLVASTAIAIAGCYSVEVVSCLAGASGMVTGLSNLFGGGSDRSGSLNAVLEGQRRLAEGQRRLAEGLLAARRELRDAHQDVLENRVVLLERAGAIDRRLTAGFADVQRSVGAVLWEVGQLSDTTIDFSDFGTRLRECEDFVRRRIEYDFNEHTAYVPRTVQFALGEFSTWGGLESHYAANGTYWRPCLRTIRDLFSRRQIYRDVHSIFRLSIYQGRSRGTLLTEYVNPGFAPLVRLISRHYSMGTGQGGMRTFCALLNSPLSYAGIDMRGATLFGRESCGSQTTTSPFDALWRRDRDSTVFTPEEWLLHVDALVELIHLMMELLPYYQITDERDGRLLGADMVVYGDVVKPREVEIEIVETAYRLVSIAIAQQVLLTGDIFLPIIHRYLFSASANRSDRDDVIDVLEHHPTLAKNWLVMEVGRQLRLGGNLPTGFVENMELYRRIFEARVSGGGDALPELRYERLFPSYWSQEASASTQPAVAFSRTANEMMIFRYGTGSSDTEHEEVRISMPTPQQVATGSYVASRGYVELTRLRRAHYGVCGAKRPELIRWSAVGQERSLSLALNVVIDIEFVDCVRVPAHKISFP